MESDIHHGPEMSLFDLNQGQGHFVALYVVADPLRGS